MLAALLLQAAVPDTALEAERAFNAMAQARGQWTAFRTFATPDAVMFNPQPEKVQELLKNAREPKIAVQWWPGESYVSCDGSVAVNTGPWVLPKASGYFTTVWQRQADGGYRWVYDGGDGLTNSLPLAEKPLVRRAKCHAGPLPQPAAVEGAKEGAGASADKSLQWHWTVWPDGRRVFTVMLWNGRGWQRVLHNKIAAAK